jgi:hypothetical protein
LVFVGTWLDSYEKSKWLKTWNVESISEKKHAEIFFWHAALCTLKITVFQCTELLHQSAPRPLAA